MVDQFGLTITISGGGSEPWTFARTGLTVVFPGSLTEADASAVALRTFNSMVPDGHFGAAPTIPDPAGFGRAIFTDSTIPIGTRLQLMPWIPVLVAQLNDDALITAGWSDLVGALSISTQNQSSIASYAAQFGIPGITA